MRRKVTWFQLLGPLNFYKFYVYLLFTLLHQEIYSEHVQVKNDMRKTKTKNNLFINNELLKLLLNTVQKLLLNKNVHFYKNKV